MAISHAQLVDSQFGSRTAAYVSSTVHAQGADLDNLVELIRGRDAAKVLDLGCGGGHVTFNAAPHVGQVVAYDLSSEMLAAVEHQCAQRKLTNVVTKQGRAESLPFPDASFDLVLSRYSAHHWHDFQAALAEVKRVLKPHGKAIFMDVISPSPVLFDTYLQAVELLRDPSHVRDYRLDEWQAMLSAAGLAHGTYRKYRLRLEFTSWITRMDTAASHVEAIRSLQNLMSEDVQAYFAIEKDGSFTIDTMLIEADN
jgi:ubiquinone/menaquinone biosynthesis C-methylase UbiE